MKENFNAYLAGSIFYYGDELRNKEWASKLRAAFPKMNLYSPIENTEINGTEGKKKFAGSKLIEQADNDRLDNTDVLIACIDGDVLPSGTCAEIGIMRSRIRSGEPKLIIGICTDNRECSKTHSAAKDKGGAADICESQYSYQNLYVVGCIKSSGVLVSTIEEAIEFLKNHIEIDESTEQVNESLNKDTSKEETKETVKENPLEDNFEERNPYMYLPSVCQRCKYRDGHPNASHPTSICVSYISRCYQCKNYQSLLTFGEGTITTPGTITLCSTNSAVMNNDDDADLDAKLYAALREIWED